MTVKRIDAQDLTIITNALEKADDEDNLWHKIAELHEKYGLNQDKLIKIYGLRKEGDSYYECCEIINEFNLEHGTAKFEELMPSKPYQAKDIPMPFKRKDLLILRQFLDNAQNKNDFNNKLIEVMNYYGGFQETAVEKLYEYSKLSEEERRKDLGFKAAAILSAHRVYYEENRYHFPNGQRVYLLLHTWREGYSHPLQLEIMDRKFDPKDLSETLQTYLMDTVGIDVPIDNDSLSGRQMQLLENLNNRKGGEFIHGFIATESIYYEFREMEGIKFLSSFYNCNTGDGYPGYRYEIVRV